MNRIDRSRPMDQQKGTTLIVALVLILLASLLALFAMNVGIFAQRTSAADMKARAVHEALEAALAQGIEYLNNNRSVLVPSNAALWALCKNTDTFFPCGAVPMCANTGADASGSGTSNGSTTCTGGLNRRANMFYYKGGAGYNVDGTANGALTSDIINQNSLPLTNPPLLTSVGNGYAVNYGVGVLMCQAITPVSTTDPVECGVATTGNSGTNIFTLVAVGNITGESATTTLSTAIGASPLAGGASGLPPIVASGTADLTGNGTFVTNNNAGGPGVPVTVWTRGCTNKTGTPNTCYMEDWLRTANGINNNSTLSFAANSDGSTSAVPVCSGNGNKTCSCSTSLSYNSPGNAQAAGIDILSNDSGSGCTDPPVNGTSACTSTSTCKSNYDVQPNEFPCDLFQYVFHVQAWQDLTGTASTGCTHDCFCETRLSKVTQTVGDGTSQSLNVDEAWLYSNALFILSTAHPTWPAAAKQVTSCAQLVSSINAKGGLAWDQTGGCLKNGGQIGYPDKPVILVEDATADNNGTTVFGLVFVRDTSDPVTVVGGAATMTTHATGTIYGSVVVQGPAAKLNGSSAIVSSAAVLGALGPLPTANPIAPLPGSWTDRYSY